MMNFLHKVSNFFSNIITTKQSFLILFSCLFFISCFKKETNLPRKTTGKINTISVIIDEQLWNGEIGDSLRNKFASPVIGLPEEEPQFTINQYPIKLLEGFATNSRAIIEVKKGVENQYKVRKNLYASPQNVFQISGNTADDILAILEEHYIEIIKQIESGEIQESQRITKLSLKKTTNLKTLFQVDLLIPSDFEIVMKRANFLWYKKKITSGSSSLLLYQIPLETLQNTNRISSKIISIRDSIGQFIKGKEPNTQMITETGYTPYFFVTQLNHIKTFETRGTWQMQNDYMSGPFINYAILDKKNNRILVLEGFCYSPSKEKRDSMHELEAIINSVRLF